MQSSKTLHCVMLYIWKEREVKDWIEKEERGREYVSPFSFLDVKNKVIDKIRDSHLYPAWSIPKCNHLLFALNM